jgi:hypothetical protein
VSATQFAVREPGVGIIVEGRLGLSSVPVQWGAQGAAERAINLSMVSKIQALVRREAAWWPLVIAWSALLAAWLTWPTVLRPGEAALGNIHADGMKHLWTLWWMRASVWTEGGLPFNTSLINYPIGMDLYPIEPLNGLFAVALPFLDVVTLSNLLVLANMTATGIAGAWLGRVLTGSRRAGFVSGTLLESSSVMAFFVHVGVGELTHLWWLPLGLGVLVKARRTLDWRWFLALSLCLVGALLSCFYLGFFLAVSVAIVALLTLWAGRQTPKLLGLYVLSASLALAVVWPVTRTFSNSYKAGDPPAVGLVSYIVDNHGQPVTDPPSARLEIAQVLEYGRTPTRREEAAYGGGRYLGFIPLGLALLGLARRPRLAIPFVAMGAVGFSLALGTYLVEGGEYVLMQGARVRLPLLWLNRALGYLAEPLNFPTRFLALAVTALAALGALAVHPGEAETPSAPVKWIRRIVPFLVLGAVVELSSGDLVPWPRDRFVPRDASSLEALRDAGDGAVIDVSLFVRPDHENRWNALSTQIAHGKPTQAVPIERIEYFAREGFVFVSRLPLLEDLHPVYEDDLKATLSGDYTKSVAILRAAGFRWILVSHRRGSEAMPEHILEQLTNFAGPPAILGRGVAVWELPESGVSAEQAEEWRETHTAWSVENAAMQGNAQGPPLQ